MKWVEYIRGKISWQVIIVMAKGVVDYNEQYLGVPVRNFEYMSNGSTIWWRSAADELDEISRGIIEKARDGNFLKKHKNEFIDFLVRIRDITEEFRVRDYTKLSDGQLIDMHKKILQIFYPFSGLTFYSVDGMDVKLEELILSKLRKLMKDVLGEDFNESLLAKEYGILTTPDELTYVNREELMINELADKNLKGGEFEKGAEKIAAKFWWVPLAWDRMPERSVKDILEKIKEINSPKSNIFDIKQRVVEAKEKKKELAKKYGFDGELNHLLNIFEEYAVLHDYRKESQMRLVYYLFTINNEIGRRKGIDPLLLDECYPEEIYSFLKFGKLDIDELKKRTKGVFYSIKESREEFYSGEKALEMVENELAKKEEIVENFSGLVASPGKATGKVKVCPGVKEASQKMQQGDILVTGMTTPDFVPYMKKAAAIVTDEGGATSHAAVISREFGIPCIVGTKIATKVLSDDMIVEVDANHNVVKVIK